MSDVLMALPICWRASPDRPAVCCDATRVTSTRHMSVTPEHLIHRQRRLIRCLKRGLRCDSGLIIFKVFKPLAQDHLQPHARITAFAAVFRTGHARQQCCKVSRDFGGDGRCVHGNLLCAKYQIPRSTAPSHSVTKTLMHHQTPCPVHAHTGRPAPPRIPLFETIFGGAKPHGGFDGGPTAPLIFPRKIVPPAVNLPSPQRDALRLFPAFARPMAFSRQAQTRSVNERLTAATVMTPAQGHIRIAPVWPGSKPAHRHLRH